MKDQIQDIIKKRDDYRIKIFNLYYTTAKTCKQFISQKCIRKIKKSNEKAYNLGDTMEDVSQKLKETENVKKNEKTVKIIKQIKSQHLKQLALLFIVEIRKYDISKQADYFNKELAGDYKRALFEVKENLQNKESEVSVYKNKLENHPKYAEFLEHCNSVLNVVEHKLGKSKVKRQIKKEKFKLKKQMKQTSEALKENQVELTEEEKLKKAEEKKQKEEERKLKMSEIKQNAIQNKYDKLAARYKNDNPKERTEFKKTGKERKQQLKQEKIEKFQKRQKEEVKPLSKEEYKIQNIRDMDQLHPSWTARLQQQEQQKNLLTFQGTVKML